MNQQELDAVARDLHESARTAAVQSDPQMQTSAFVRRMTEFVEKNGGRAQGELLRTILRNLLSENTSKIGSLNYPESVRQLVRNECARLTRIVAEAPTDWFDLKEHRTRAEFRAACFARISVGVEHIETGGVPRSLILKGGLRQTIRFLRGLRETGGCRPYYVSHLAYGLTLSAFLRVYSLKAQADLLHNIAGCLELNPEFRGYFSSSWWYDPQLETAAPHLAYLRKGMVEKGALLFRHEASMEALQMATARSPERQRLYAEGKYRPTSYAILWPRDRLIAWSRSHRTDSRE